MHRYVRVCVCVCVCVHAHVHVTVIQLFVAHCLATKVFIRQIAGYGKGVGDHRVFQ